ncbi:histidinol-phosphate transaminase [bacterium]
MKKKFEKLVRKEISQFEPYMPGKPINELKRELGLKRIVKLASNENSYGTSSNVLKKLAKIHDLYRYPESSCYDLRQIIAKKNKINQSLLLFGNGSDEIIELLGKTFLNKEDNIIASKHSFIRYKMASDLMGAKTKEIKMTKDLNYDVNKIINSIDKNTKMIFIANPNNPTGTYIAKKEFELLLKSIPKNVLLIMDEAYYEYIDLKDYPQTINYLKKYPNLVILRTFSKLYGLAGMRIGYMIANEEIISYIDRIRPPFNVNLIAQKIAVEALKDNKTLARVKNKIQKQKEYLYKEFNKLNIKYVSSAANFILFKCSLKGKAIFKKLLKEGVIIRAVDEYELPDYARVTIGTENENRYFISKLKKVLEETK